MKTLHKDMTIEDFVQWCEEHKNIDFSIHLNGNDWDIARIWREALMYRVKDTFTVGRFTIAYHLQSTVQFIHWYGLLIAEDPIEEVNHDLQQFFNDNKSDLS